MFVFVIFNYFSVFITVSFHYLFLCSGFDSPLTDFKMVMVPL